MKYIEKYLETVVKIKPLGELTTKDDELNGMSGEMVYIDGKCSDIFISHADYANWLEKKAEKNSAWSEEDENMMRGILAYISCSCAPEGFEEWYDWLKSLKTRITWKPSEEQMNTLDLVVSDYYHACTKECDEKAIALKSILEQLKQL